mmetsp:Transcript_21988/g.49756  ORF Transcript_21988/g.49756 Transcript_21988/m.49756 type:complete len:287 (+) Transcript_21988:1179-2039(+)
MRFSANSARVSFITPRTLSVWSTPPVMCRPNSSSLRLPESGLHVTVMTDVSPAPILPVSGLQRKAPALPHRKSAAALPGLYRVRSAQREGSSESKGNSISSSATPMISSMGTTSAVTTTLETCMLLIFHWNTFFTLPTWRLMKQMSNPARQPCGTTWHRCLDCDNSASSSSTLTTTEWFRSLATEKLLALVEPTLTRPKSSSLCEPCTSFSSSWVSSTEQSRSSACVAGVLAYFFTMRRFSSAGMRRPAPAPSPSDAPLAVHNGSPAGGSLIAGSSRPLSMPIFTP